MNIDFRDVTIFLLVGALIWALRCRPTPRTAAALPVPETAADEGKVLHGKFNSERDERLRA